MLEPLPASLRGLATPALVVDLDRLERNLDEMAALALARGVRLRPHAKTHKCAAIARRQLERGAVGLTVALVEEAETLVGHGVADVLVAFPVVDGAKAGRLAALAARARVACFADSVEGVRALGGAAAECRTTLDVLLEVDCGQRRTGVEPGGAALLDLARAVAASPALRLRGVGTHAGHVYGARSPGDVTPIGRAEGDAAVLAATRLRAAGHAVDVVSVGSTPTAASASAVAGVTELRPGTYVFHDATQVALGVADLGRCALAVLATCVSRPAPDRAVLDAGAKALALDRGDLVGGHGILLRAAGRTPVPGARIERLSEEHGIVEMGAGSDVAVGERLLVVPNHACPVVNLFDRMFGVRVGGIEEILAIDARGHRENGP